MEDPDLTNYPNLGAFFYRTLKPGARIVDERAPLVMSDSLPPCSKVLKLTLRVRQVSPSDGTVLHFGLITEERTVEQIKGVTYSLDALLGHKKINTDPDAVSAAEPGVMEIAKKTHSREIVSEKKFAEINSIDYSLDKILGDESPKAGAPHAHGGHQLRPGNGLFFAVIYLAPGDYHRFHSPANWIIELRRHFSGELFSVSPFAVNLIKNLFVLNERVVLMGNWQHGFFSMIPVGATNVGSIRIDHDPVCLSIAVV